MNFYSDQIVNSIIDQEPLEEIVDKIDVFWLQTKYIMTRYSMNSIYHRYVDGILEDPKIVVVYHCLDQNNFDVYNCPSVLVYRKVRDSRRAAGASEASVRSRRDVGFIYYILFTCTKKAFRGQGYGSRLLDGLQDRIRKENMNNIPQKIVCSSVEDAVTFYEDYGFHWTRKSIKGYPILMKYESYQEGKEYFIMEKEVR